MPSFSGLLRASDRVAAGTDGVSFGGCRLALIWSSFSHPFAQSRFASARVRNTALGLVTGLPCLGLSRLRL